MKRLCMLLCKICQKFEKHKYVLCIFCILTLFFYNLISSSIYVYVFFIPYYNHFSESCFNYVLDFFVLEFKDQKK